MVGSTKVVTASHSGALSKDLGSRRGCSESEHGKFFPANLAGLARQAHQHAVTYQSTQLKYVCYSLRYQIQSKPSFKPSRESWLSGRHLPSAAPHPSIHQITHPSPIVSFNVTFDGADIRVLSFVVNGTLRQRLVAPVCFCLWRKHSTARFRFFNR